MKRLDIIIIILLLIISLGSFYFIKSTQKNTDEIIAKIYVDEELIREITLNNSKEKEIIEVNTKHGHNIIEIDNGRIRVKESDCPDKICVKDGFISKPGEIVVCLPHKVVIQIKGEDKLPIDDYSY